MSSGVERLWKNVQGYYGERIDIAAVQRDCLMAAQAHGWEAEKLKASSEVELLAFSRRASSGTQHRFRLYISAGIHGDEPAGPLAVRQLLQDNLWPTEVNIWICPCLNPAGFVKNRRENAEGLDLNRQYLDPVAPETLAHIAWLKAQPDFDLCLCLHEDWESHGFYVYELNPDNRPSLAQAIVDRVADVCPIDPSEIIEGRAAHKGIIRPNVDSQSRPQWPEAFFLLTHKTRLSYTLEAPSDFPLATRAAALVAGVRAAIVPGQEGDAQCFKTKAGS